MPCFFIRFGGCDYRCGWCDTPHAVLPDQVSKLPKMSAGLIYLNIQKLFPMSIRTADWVVLTGGNPALLDLTDVVNVLHGVRFRIMVETQGTIFNEWLTRVEDVCVSPKPPSAGNSTSVDVLDKFLSHWKHPIYGYVAVGPMNPPYLKVVVFDKEDYEYARDVRVHFPDLEMFLSVGNEDPSLPTVGNPHPTAAKTDIIQLRNQLSVKYRTLVERCLKDKAMRDVKVLPQLHVLAWGNQRGH